MTIEIIMTVALLLYFVAYFVARHAGRYWWAHIIVACVAFAMDAWGTYIMWKMDLPLTGWVPITHTVLTLTAIALFFVQAGLGALRMREKHILFAKWIFLPAWVISFMSGFLFAL